MDGDTPKPGETQTPKAPENGTQAPAPNTGNASDAAEVEKLRKELEQQRMRANQLENEKQEREKAEADKQTKRLEEQNEFKTLHEQEKAKREALEAEIAAGKRAKELKVAKDEVLADYSDEVKALAEEAGMTLSTTDDDAKATFKEKLDKIQKMVGSSSKVGPNNPGKPSGKPELSQSELRVALKDEAKFHEIVSQRPGLAMMTKQR